MPIDSHAAFKSCPKEMQYQHSKSHADKGGMNLQDKELYEFLIEGIAAIDGILARSLGVVKTAAEQTSGYERDISM